MNEQRNASEAERKVRVQFTKEVEELTSLIRDKQSKSKQQPGKSSTTSREELQSTAHRCDKKLHELVTEVNSKTFLGYKTFEDSDRRNKIEVLYQQTVHLLEEKIPKQLRLQKKLAPYPTNFVEEHLKVARKCKAGLDLGLHI